MKILFFIYSLGSGGAERVTAELASYWAKLGHKITIVTIADRSFDFYTLDPSIKKISLNLANKSSGILSAIINNIFIITKLNKIIKRESPHATIAMMSTASILLALTPAKNTIKIGSERIYPPAVPLGKVWEFMRKASYKNLDTVVAQTTEIKEWIKQNTNAKNICIIANPISLPLKNTEPYAEIPKSNSNHILAVGRLEVQKGFDMLIEAFSQISSKHPKWELTIVGEGTQRAVLQTKIDQLKLQLKIHLLGQAGNISDWYKRSDIFVMSSRFEGFPNALVEALAHGLPSISFDCKSGPNDIILNNKNGILVEDGNIEKLAIAMSQLINNEQMRKEYAKKATDIKDIFFIDKISKQWLDLFDKKDSKL